MGNINACQNLDKITVDKNLHFLFNNWIRWILFELRMSEAFKPPLKKVCLFTILYIVKVRQYISPEITEDTAMMVNIRTTEESRDVLLIIIEWWSPAVRGRERGPFFGWGTQEFILSCDILHPERFDVPQPSYRQDQYGHYLNISHFCTAQQRDTLN